MRVLAIITGASRGIGRAAAAHFISAGWSVCNISRTKCDVQGVVNHSCDLYDTRQLKTLLEQLDLSRYERISVVHNAAVLRKDNSATISEQDFLNVLKLNVLVPQTINQYLIPRMPPESSLIFVGSTLSEIAAPNLLSYVTSKHALAGLMKATCLDIAEKQMHTCLVCPGFTDTQMLRESVGSDERNLMNVTKLVILKRLIDPDEIAKLIFFCSNNAVINGAVLHANLGQF